jgi:hypothetical protein
LFLAGLGIEIMIKEEDRRIKGIARQIGLLKSEIQKESKRNMMLFLLGLTAGLLANVVIQLLSL